MTVRVATKDDLPALVEMAREFHSISPFKDYRFSPGGTRNYLASIMISPDSIIFMTDNGAIGGQITDAPFCDARFAKESFWFTSDRDGEGRRDGLKLLRMYMRWLDSEGVDVDLMSVLELDGVDFDGVCKLLSSFKYESVEFTFMRRVG